MSLFTKIPPLLFDEGRLAEFITGLPFSAHVRDVESDKYILANDYQAKNHGFSRPNEVTGCTQNELIAIRKKKTLEFNPSQALLTQHWNLFKEANYRVEESSQAVRFIQHPSLIPSGFICVGNVFKWPLLNSNGNTTAVLTCFIETTQQTDLLKLYALYKQYLPKKIAIDQFIKYLKIKPFFNANPTESELIILLTMRKTSVHKLIAQHLNMQLVTVNTHIQHLKAKLKEIHCEQLAMLLRDFHYEKTSSINQITSHKLVGECD